MKTGKDLVRENIEKIGELFPGCVTVTADRDGKMRKTVNMELLRQLLTEEETEEEEAYSFTWVGKRAAMEEAARPARHILVPQRDLSLDWEKTGNFYIEGDNLEVLKILQRDYQGKIKMIYIDPPYNTGHDFVYRDSFAMDSGRYRDLAGREGETVPADGRYHSHWCSMMYSRLAAARRLLTEDGILFMSIDDNEMGNLLKIAGEIFGSSHFLACFPRITKKAGKTTEAIAKNHDYVLAFSKGDSPKFYLPSHTDAGFKYSDEYVGERGKYKLNQTLDYNSLSYSPSLDYPIELDGEIFYPGNSYEKYLERKAGRHARADWAWRWSRELFDFGLKNGFVVVKKYENYSRIYTKTYQNARIVKTGSGFAVEHISRTRAISTLEFVENRFSNDNGKKNLLKLFDTSVFDYAKPVSLIKTLVQYSTAGDDLVLDFFSGSGTTAQAVMEQNLEDGGKRKFILVQIPEATAPRSDGARAGFQTICEIGRERIRRAGEKIREEHPLAAGELDLGFRVYGLEEERL